MLIFRYMLGALLFFGGLCSTACANTLVIVLRTEEASIIAADSKVGTLEGGDNGTVCKIGTTGDFIWTTSGIDDPSGYDVRKIIVTAIEKGGSFDDIISRFELDIVSQLKQLLVEMKKTDPIKYGEAVEHGHVATPILIQKTNVRTRDITVPNKDDPNDIEVARYDCPGNGCRTGSSRLMTGVYDAASAEIALHPNIWEEKGTIGTINYLMDVQSRATPTIVGGPVSILRMDKSGTLSWLQKGICD
jgi:hypothetical protein